MRLRKILLGLVVLAWCCRPGPALAAKPVPIAPGDFDKLHHLIRPAADESHWREVPWLLNTVEARKKAAAEGKPILVWYGGGSPPIGAC
jgi:hypothetical protein